MEIPKLDPNLNNEDEVRKLAANRDSEQAKIMADIADMKAKLDPKLRAKLENVPPTPGWPPGPVLSVRGAAPPRGPMQIVGFSAVPPQK